MLHRKWVPHFISCCCLLCAGRWTVVCRCRTERGCPTSSTVACGGGPIYKITRSSAPLSAVSSHFISSWIECASTPTTTRVSRRQVRTIFLLLLLWWYASVHILIIFVLKTESFKPLVSDILFFAHFKFPAHSSSQITGRLVVQMCYQMMC